MQGTVSSHARSVPGWGTTELDACPFKWLLGGVCWGQGLRGYLKVAKFA